MRTLTLLVNGEYAERIFAPAEYACKESMRQYRRRGKNLCVSWENAGNIDQHIVFIYNRGDFYDFFPMYCIQHCFICCTSYSTVSEYAVIKTRTVATSALDNQRPQWSQEKYCNFAADVAFKATQLKVAITRWLHLHQKEGLCQEENITARIWARCHVTKENEAKNYISLWQDGNPSHPPPKKSGGSKVAGPPRGDPPKRSVKVHLSPFYELWE